jgi:hypothetical protein
MAPHLVASAPAAGVQAASEIPTSSPKPDQTVSIRTGDETAMLSPREILERRLLERREGQIKATSSGAAWDALINQIANARVPIRAETLENGNIKFSVPSLSTQENQVLYAERFAHRVNNRLAAIHDTHQREISRLVRWIESKGREPSALILENRTASLGPNVRPAIRTLFRHWRGDGLVLAAIRQENTRRIELAKSIARRAAAAVTLVDLEQEERRAEAARIYPTPDQAYTPEVHEFIRLLRELAPDHELRAAAERIEASPSAREDITKHTVELAQKYEIVLGELPQLGSSRGREQGR